ncbi:MAG: response regulator [Rhodopseudomonas palustris]|uniref:Response regulator n=1 Tax=Rhodopseudomonas palustris TaxID=1076 RepID=A0A933W034_RHOPL|nr:response regulator [Rhodopseudomonas palustris]
MSLSRILHVDDEADIREVVAISLGLDPEFSNRSCGSGAEALAVAADWLPDIILMDVMMPVMDGPATLALLRDNPLTASVPVVFMTARAQTRELDHFRALGAVGVIAKPFDPMTLAAAVRAQLRPAADPLDALRANFLKRLGKDIAALVALRAQLVDGSDITPVLSGIRKIAHGLAGAGGIFGFAAISAAAVALEEAVIAGRLDPGPDAAVDDAIGLLIAHSAQHESAMPGASGS